MKLYSRRKKAAADGKARTTNTAKESIPKYAVHFMTTAYYYFAVFLHRAKTSIGDLFPRWAFFVYPFSGTSPRQCRVAEARRLSFLRFYLTRKGG
jgi:hypothetical protein